MIIQARENASVLFPSRKEGYYNYEAINKRIKTYLTPEDYDWAKEFVYSVVANPEYENIKKKLLTLPLNLLSQYHVYIQNIFNNENLNCLEALDAINAINTDVLRLASGIINIKFPTINDKEGIKNVIIMIQDMESKILDKDSTFIKEAYQRFDDTFREIKKPYLEDFIRLEKDNFYKTILKAYLHLTESCNEKIEKIKDSGYKIRRFEENSEYLIKSNYNRGSNSDFYKKHRN